MIVSSSGIRRIRGRGSPYPWARGWIPPETKMESSTGMSPVYPVNLKDVTLPIQIKGEGRVPLQPPGRERKG